MVPRIGDGSGNPFGMNAKSTMSVKNTMNAMSVMSAKNAMKVNERHEFSFSSLNLYHSVLSVTSVSSV
ncbi:MAG: hypothetical protein MJ057_03020 [Sphaerochaetaceae bacterium]|nr:hypothetical protein [Sphaerochaetaceae bacterium]